MSKATRNVRTIAERAIRSPDQKDPATLHLLHAVFWVGQALERIERRLDEVESRPERQSGIGMKGALKRLRRVA